MTSMQLVKDPEGQSYIPPSQRPDGSWRKPIRVKDGYVPQDEQPVYVSKGRQPGSSNNYPVGLSPSDIESFRGGESSSGSTGFPVGYFDISNYTPKAAIPGLNFAESSTEALPAGGAPKSKSKKGKGGTASSVSSQGNATTTGTSAKSSIPPGGSAGTAAAASSQQVDPAKRLRNLKKRLKEIEELEKRIMSGELPSPEKEQLEKLKRKDEVQDEVEDLEKLVAKLNVS